jgi:biopolymer transport protein ExbB
METLTEASMRLVTTVLCILTLSISSFAGPPDANETISQLSLSAEQEMAKSIQELAQTREQIAAEKLPLGQELTSLEEKLVEVRRKYELATRLVDASNLEMTTIKAETKARRDELTYIGTLLDEYARSFESKVNVCELQQYGQAMETAKQALENTALSPREKFTHQTAFVNVSLRRLLDTVEGLRFSGTAVDPKGKVVEGQFAIIGPVALFHSKESGVAGLVIPQSGSAKPMIRPLDGGLQAGIVTLVDSGEGILPLDPSRGGALKALVQKTSLIRIFKKGGPIMWPLLVAATLSLMTVLERIFFLLNERRKRDPHAVEEFFAAVSRQDMESAIRISQKSKFFIVRTLGYALAHRESSLANALLFAQEKELKRFRRGIPVLDTVITLAPLLGLLGTVTGMMGSFSLIGGELSAPGAITGGIAEALIATAFGLSIAITSLIPFNVLNARMEEARHEIESAAKELELQVHPSAGAEASDGKPIAVGSAPEVHERGDDFAVQQEMERKEREARQKREALRKQMAELKSKIDEQVQEMQHLADEEQGLRGVLVQDLPTEE